jgi:putative cell wall-binding protein
MLNPDTGRVENIDMDSSASPHPPAGGRRRIGAALAVAVALGILPAAAPAFALVEETGGSASSPVERFAGSDRILTAIHTSQHAFPGGASAVVIARADDYPDALAGAPLAAAVDAPVLLSSPGGLPADVAQEIRRLGASSAILLRGTGALSAEVDAGLRAAGVTSVQRLAGDNRFATARQVADAVLDRTGATQAYVARGIHPSPTGGWPDAVAVSALAAAKGRPILLTGDGAVPAATSGLVRARGLSTVTVVGGTAVVPDSALAELRAAGAQVRRLAGTNRYETSLAIADEAVSEGLSSTQIWLVTGTNYPDALTAGAAAASTGGVLVLVDGNGWTGSVARGWLALRRRSLSQVYVVGGATVLPDRLTADVTGLLDDDAAGWILMYSTARDLSNPRPVDGAVVSGTVYLWLEGPEAP